MHFHDPLRKLVIDLIIQFFQFGYSNYQDNLQKGTIIYNNGCTT